MEQLQKTIIELQNALRKTNNNLNTLRMNLKDLDSSVMEKILSEWINENKEVIKRSMK